MNKQQLAAKIWESANRMRSKIEANEYKDYILGFIFYKYLSDTEMRFLLENHFSTEEIENLDESDPKLVSFIQQELGYFIAYDHLFSTWLKKGKDFSAADVRDALNAFSRLIDVNHKKVFDGILNTLQTGLSKLGDSTGTQTKAISGLIQLIKDIPMDGKQDYDVLGFIYEYLIGKFAANAGKKAGEFYTPFEVSSLMSEIVAYHLKDRDRIEIYDPTSGSGSLLINIGRAAVKYLPDKNKIKYYAQEIKENTYNLTRMNLVMRGIVPDNIVTRNGDTLEEDWPYFDDSDPLGTYDPLYVDAVVSNPPYSQAWDPTSKENDARFAAFGIAPKTKADFAFLLHDLYHLKPDGIMTIILPHGVLFRGGEEGNIRRNLIEKNHIDAIIGLPANIFYGTGIPVVILVLKKIRKNNDVLIIDASKGFIKEGKNNKLRESDIKRIVDTVTQRLTTEKYSRTVSQEEIRSNEYNLNIPRYVDSSEPAESWDLYASMFGGIPLSEVDAFAPFWQALPGLKEELFCHNGTPYLQLATENIDKTIRESIAVARFKANYDEALESFPALLRNTLLNGWQSVDINRLETTLSDDIFKRFESIPLVDKYSAYQVLRDEWSTTIIDLEILQTEGINAARTVDPNMVTKKKGGVDEEVQDGWKGRVIPFDLVQKTILKDQANQLEHLESRLLDVQASYEEIIDSLSEEEKESEILNEAGDAFAPTEVAKALKMISLDIETPEMVGLTGYLDLIERNASIEAKIAYVKNTPQVAWRQMDEAKNGTYTKSKISAYIQQIQESHEFDDESFEGKVVRVSQLIDEERELKSLIKKKTIILHQLTKEKIEQLSDEQVIEMLDAKWVLPLTSSLGRIPDDTITKLISSMKNLVDKYASTYSDVARDIHETKLSLASMIDDLMGSDFDLQGLREFQAHLRGE